MLSTATNPTPPATLPDISARSNNPFEAARLSLIKKLLAAVPPKPIATYPFVSDFLAVRDHVADFSAIFDEWLEEIGHQVNVNASHSVDMSVFNGAYTGAVQGNATFEIEEAAESIRNDQDEEDR